MLISTRRVIKVLLEKGFNRTEFSVQTPYSNKRKGYEWATVYFRNDKALLKAIEKAKELADTNELKVTVYNFKNYKHIIVREGCGEFEIIDLYK